MNFCLIVSCNFFQTTHILPTAPDNSVSVPSPLSSLSSSKPVISFGVIADIQYADKKPGSKRYYRQSLHNLDLSVRYFNQQHLDFIIQLGDLIDGRDKVEVVGVGQEGDAQDLSRVLSVLNTSKAPVYHVLGNHDFFQPRQKLLPILGLNRAYQSFVIKGWKFIILDGMDVSVSKGWSTNHPNYILGRKMSADLVRKKSPNSGTWNGAVGNEQLAWLKNELKTAKENDQKVIVFCHFPVKPTRLNGVYLLWNYQEVMDVLTSSAQVQAYIAGHNHQGSFNKEGSIRFVTIPGMVEAPNRNAWAVVLIFPDRIVIKGFGKVVSRFWML